MRDRRLTGLVFVLVGLLFVQLNLGCTFAKRGDFMLVRFGYDTQIGRLEYTRDGEGERLRVNDLDSKATAADTLNEAVKRIPVGK